MEVESKCKIRSLRSDRGGEYMSNSFQDLLDSRGIKHQKVAPYSSEQNGKAERLNRTLVEKARCMLHESGAPMSLWAEAMLTACYLHNISPTRGQDCTPYELWHGVKPDLAGLRVFGAPAYKHIPKQLRRKLDSKTEKGIFVGYEPGAKAYRLFINGSIKISKDVQVDESFATSKPKISRADILLEDEDDELPSLIPDSDSDDDMAEAGDNGHNGRRARNSGSDSGNDSSAKATRFMSPEPSPRRSGRINQGQRPLRYGLSAIAKQPQEIIEPTSLQQALDGPQAAEWSQAMNEELKSLHENQTWQLVPRSPHLKIVPLRWVYKVKRDALGNIERFKARLVAKGYKQIKGIDYDEVYAPVNKQVTFRVLMAMVAEHDMILKQLDIKTAFLYGQLQEEVYMEQPPGFEEGDNICKLKKAIYGLKQAPRAWHTRLVQELENIGFQTSDADPGLFIYRDCNGIIYLLVYVDDLLLATSKDNESALESIKQRLGNIFHVHSLGDASYFLGMRITHDSRSRTLTVSQQRYASELVTKYGLNDAIPRTTPMNTAIKLVREGEPLDTARYSYSSVVGELLYLAVCTRPDISYAVGALARFVSAPTTLHWEAAMWLLRYISGTKDYDLVYSDSSAHKGSFCRQGQVMPGVHGHLSYKPIDYL